MVSTSKDEITTRKVLHVSTIKKMISHTLVALVDSSVPESDVARITDDPVDDFNGLDEDDDEEDKEEDPGVLEA
jgi:hypothetical protein